MKLETIKTFILIILVALSLLLTFSLWNYKPDYELHYPQSKLVNEVDLGGNELSKKPIIQPKTIVFHDGEEILGFPDAQVSRDFYKEIQQWELDEFHLQNNSELSSDINLIEITFPLAIPLELIKPLYSIDDDQAYIPDWSFQQIFITYDESEANLYVYFRSVDNEYQVRFKVNDSDAYEQLLTYMNKESNLISYASLGTDVPVYIPADRIEMKRRSLSVKTIEPTLLVNALFRNPSLVSPNVGEAYFTDGQRGMRVKQDGRSMEFINPIPSKDERLSFNELLELSLDHINGHKGWTDLYSLSEINEVKNTVSFRMEYEGYPIHSNGDLSVIKQVWRDHDLHQYIRPLLNLNNVLGVESVQIPSGNDIIFYIKNSPNFKESDIQDIQIGYRLAYIDGATFSVTLEPTWYINNKGVWQEVRLEDIEVHEQGGA